MNHDEHCYFCQAEFPADLWNDLCAQCGRKLGYHHEGGHPHYCLQDVWRVRVGAGTVFEQIRVHAADWVHAAGWLCLNDLPLMATAWLLDG